MTENYAENAIFHTLIYFASLCILVCEKIIAPNPTILIDTVRRPQSEDNRVGVFVKKVARRMGVPTVSANFGKYTAIEGWEDLDEVERTYLIQIPPPGSLITQVVRDIAVLQTMTTTGVLLDQNLSKYESIFLD